MSNRHEIHMQSRQDTATQSQGIFDVVFDVGYDVEHA